MASNPKKRVNAEQRPQDDGPRPKKRQKGTTFFDSDILDAHHLELYQAEYARCTPQIYAERHFQTFVMNWNELISLQKALADPDGEEATALFYSIRSLDKPPVRVTIDAANNPYGGLYLSGSILSKFATPYAAVLNICCNYFEAPSVVHAEVRILIDALHHSLPAEEVWLSLQNEYGVDHPPRYQSLIDAFRTAAIRRVGSATKAVNFGKNLQEFLDSYIVWETNAVCLRWLIKFDSKLDELRARWHEYYDEQGKPIAATHDTPTRVVVRWLMDAMSQKLRPIYQNEPEDDNVFRSEWLRLSPINPV